LKYVFGEAKYLDAAWDHVGDLAALAYEDGFQDHAAQQSFFEQVVALDCHEAAA
jgi:hypothetical protein